MGILGDIARENLAKEVCHLIDRKSAKNRSNPDVQQALKELRGEVLDLLDYRIEVPVREK